MKYILLAFLLLLSPRAVASYALIYAGQGVCEEGCATTFQYILQKTDLRPVLVFNDSTNYDIFKDAKVWIQPGGYSVEEITYMPTSLYNKVINFVSNGGGYVGFCAGAFSATQYIGTTGVLGFGIFPGSTQLYGKGIDMLEINWGGKKRFIYWEGGPFLYNLPATAEPIAYYPTGQIAAARSTFGKGRVFITGVHPEAPPYWRQDPYLPDPDGLDYDLVLEMIDWTIQK